MELLKHVNWVDLLVLVIAIRIIYISAQTGFAIELLKTFAVLAALLVAFHFYTDLGVLGHKTFFTPETLSATAFVFLWILTLVICKFIRDGLFMIFAVTAEGPVDKWGAVVIAAGRVALTASMAMFLLLASGQKYLQAMTLSSLSGRHVLLAAPVIYRETCDRFVTRLFPDQKKNPAVGQLLRDSVRK